MDFDPHLGLRPHPANRVRSWRDAACRPFKTCDVGLVGLLLGALGLLAACEGCRPAPVQTSSYYQPLTSPGTQFAALPPAVQNTIRAETGSADIDGITRKTNSGRVVYRIQFKDSERYPTLLLAPDGAILSSNLTVAVGSPGDLSNPVVGGPVAGLTLNDLPPAVVLAVQRQVPDSAVDTILKETHGDRVTYTISFKDRAHPPLHLAADGTAP
jgi:hypothetical protein